MKNLTILSLMILLFGMGCTKPKDNSFTLYRVSIDYLGSEGNGFCGYILSGRISSTAKNSMKFKIIDLPDSLTQHPGYEYTAKVAIHPTKPKCHCKDVTVDVPPGQPFKTYDLDYAYLLDIKKN